MPVLKNPRHEKFSQLVASGINPTEAYVSLGYSKTGAKQAAYNLRTRTDVGARIEEILSTAAISTAAQVAFDKERVLNRLDVLSRKAEDLNQIAAAARCEELIGRLRGLFVEKVDASHSIKSIRDIPTEVLDQMIEEARAVLGELPDEEPAKLLAPVETAIRTKTSVDERASITSATGNLETAGKIAARLPEIQEARDREWWLRRIAEIVKIAKTDRPGAMGELQRLSGGVTIPKEMYRSPEVLAGWLAENALAPA
jgi:hypothetical protein